MRNVFRLAGLVASIAIGAGFATGREIKKYFTGYGIWGYAVMIAAAVMLFAAEYGIICFSMDKRLYTVSDMSRALWGRRFGGALSVITVLFLFAMYVMMLAAHGSLLWEQFHIPRVTGILLLCLLALSAVFLGFGNLSRLSGVMGPLIAVFVTIFMAVTILLTPSGFTNLEYDSAGVSTPLNNCFTAPFLYAGYNSIVALSILPRISKSVDRRTAFWGCLLGVAAVFFCILLINLCFTAPDAAGIVKNSDMPSIDIITGFAPGLLKKALAVVLSLTMALSAANSAVGFAGAAASLRDPFPSRGKEKMIGLVMVLAGLPVAFFGFGPLMDIFYPIFGGSGILLFIALAVRFLK